MLVNVENTLKELIDNNKKILENRITEEIIEKFIEYLARDPEAKYIDLLNVLIICNGQPIPMNQKRVTKIIMDSEKLKNQILVFLDQKTKDKILLSFNNEIEYQNISIENLKSLSGKRDAFKTFDYVVQLVKFLADLCSGNNFSAIYALRPLYPLSACISIITNPLLGKDLRGAFAQLVTRLWTTGSDTHQSYLKRFYCKVWDNISDNQKIAITDDVISNQYAQFANLWEFIKNFFNSQLEQADLQNFSTIDFFFSLSLLELSKDLLQDDILSVENDIEGLRHIVSQLLSKIFSNSELFTGSNEERRYFIECKLKLIEIYRIILNFDTEKFISMMLYNIKSTNNHNEYEGLGELKGETKKLSDGTKENGLYDIDFILKKLSSSAFKNDLVSEIEAFVRVKEEEHQLVNCLLASSLQKNEDLKIKSLDLLLSLFSKNEGLEVFIKRLILIESGEESKIFSSILDNARKLELSKEKFESNIAGQGNDFSDFSTILRALTINVKQKFEKKNSYKDIIEFLEKSNQS